MLLASLALAFFAAASGWLHPPDRKSADGVASSPAPLAVAPPDTFRRVCAACHGPNGQGNREIGAPSIAALPRWYVEEQLRRFRSGWRGADPADTNGQKMRAAIAPLSDAELAEAVGIVTALPQAVHAPTLEGDAKNGAWFFEMECMGCHRYNGHGELAFKSGPISGLPDWYLLGQLEKFRDGIRGYHPDDEHGRKMRQIVGGLNAEEIRDILAYVLTLAERYPLKDAR